MGDVLFGTRDRTSSRGRRPRRVLRGWPLGLSIGVTLGVLLGSGAYFVHGAESRSDHATSSLAAFGLSGSSASTLTVTGTVVLKTDLYCRNLNVSPGALLTLAGHSVICSGTIINHGTISGGAAPARGYPESYGGSGGGGDSNACNASSGAGFSTRVPGGAGQSNLTGNGSVGTTPGAPSLSFRTLRTWFISGMSNFLAGAAGQTVCGKYGVPQAGGFGSFGIYLQAASVDAGALRATGSRGSGTCSGYGLGGGGGGGVIVIAYGKGGLVPGTYIVGGGAGIPSCSGSSYSGAGGGGQVGLFNMSTSGTVITSPVFVPTIRTYQNCASVDGFAFSFPYSGAANGIVFRWGDGNVSSGTFPATHAYATAGTYPVQIDVSYASGAHRIVARSVTVNGSGSADPSNLLLGIPEVHGHHILVNGVPDRNACGPNATLPWRFSWGDGLNSSTNFPATHNYAMAGTYRLCASGLDSFGRTTNVCERFPV